MYFYETNNYINCILTLSLDHKLRINFAFILSIFSNSFVLMWSRLSFVFIERECKKIIIFQFSTLNWEEKKEKRKRNKNLIKIIFQITISLILEGYIILITINKISYIFINKILHYIVVLFCIKKRSAFAF